MDYFDITNANVYDVLMMVTGYDTYKNEFETIKSIMSVPNAQDSMHVWWNSLKVVDNKTKYSTSESMHLRELGNKLFKDSPEQNTLDACRLYTKAILAAPPGSEALALAHANRAIALQKFGYFQQAYDDCECALEQGYPKNLRHEIIARQAICAEKLEDSSLLEKHLNSLTALPLNETYTTQVEELKNSLEKFKLEEKNSDKNEQNNKEYKEAYGNTKIASNGRCLIADKSIKKDELIFTERARSFIPASGRHVCQHCAAIQFIPFPCYNCNGKVLYCSYKCRIAHQVNHVYECLAYQKDIIDTNFSHSFLAFRILLDELPEIISFLCKKRTAKDIWNELTCEKSNLMQSNHPYTQTLSMATHLKNKSLHDILNLGGTANIYSWYLRNQTDFFNLFKNTKASLSDWQLVVGSLILRHLGQLHINGLKLTTLAIDIKSPFDSALFLNELWQSPFHVRRGLLHKFCSNLNIVGNFPYYSICNNTCTESIIIKRNGRCISAFAVNNIEAGSEIFTSYTSGYLNESRLERQRVLMNKFYFQCKCIKCTKESPDEDWEKFHRFRCEKCSQNFIAETDKEVTYSYKCTKCHAIQNNLYTKLDVLSNLLVVPSNEMCVLETLVNTYMDLDQWLLGSHDIKFKLSLKVVNKCFKMADIAFSHQFNFYDFSQIIDILKFHLRCNIERFHLKSNSYVASMIHLWDFIALGKYQCTAKEMEEMLQAIEFLPDETRTLFINYYNDYIVGNIK